MKVERTGDYYTATIRTNGVLAICEAPTRMAALQGAFKMHLERHGDVTGAPPWRPVTRSTIMDWLP